MTDLGKNAENGRKTGDKAEGSGRGRATELLKQLIRIPSISGEEERLSYFLEDRFREEGMKVYRDPYGNLYAEYRFEDGGPVVLFNTHLDNVPVGEGWETDPFGAEERDGVIYGRGACDPKGAMAAMVTAIEQTIRETEENGASKKKGMILFMGAVSEEISPPEEKGTWKAVKKGLVQADMAICGEPTDNIPCIGEFGKMEYEISTRGRSAHASAPERGSNAILHLARLLTALDERVERKWSNLLKRKGTWNVGLISGGVQVNIVPERATALVERRLVPGQTAQESMEELHRICQEVKEEIPELDYEIRTTGEGNAAVISSQEPVARLMKESVEKAAGKTYEDRGFVAHADADWLITYGGIPTVIYGPGALAHAHTNREQVRAADVEEAAAVLTIFLDKALRGTLEKNT